MLPMRCSIRQLTIPSAPRWCPPAAHESCTRPRGPAAEWLSPSRPSARRAAACSPVTRWTADSTVTQAFFCLSLQQMWRAGHAVASGSPRASALVEVEVARPVMGTRFTCAGWLAMPEACSSCAATSANPSALSACSSRRTYCVRSTMPCRPSMVEGWVAGAAAVSRTALTPGLRPCCWAVRSLP